MYSQLSPNGHLYKTDTSFKMDTWCQSLQLFSIHFTVTILSQRCTTDTFEIVKRHFRSALCSKIMR